MRCLRLVQASCRAGITSRSAIPMMKPALCILAVCLSTAGCGSDEKRYTNDERGAYEMGYYIWQDSVAETGVTFGSGEEQCQSHASYFAVGTYAYPFPADTIHLWRKGLRGRLEPQRKP